MESSRLTGLWALGTGIGDFVIIQHNNYGFAVSLGDRTADAVFHEQNVVPRDGHVMGIAVLSAPSWR